jgi:RNA polymerase sigma factor (sigma-70 family)
LKVKQLIDETAFKIVAELKKANLIKSNKLGTFSKTEFALYHYHEWKTIDSDYTKKFVEIIEKSLLRIESDEYFDIITLKYFDGMTHEKIAEQLNVDEKTVRYHKNRLINKLRPIMYSDDYIRELIFDL